MGAPECGDVMKLQIKVNVETGVIEDAKFKTFGCGSAIASSSLATEWLKGATVDEAAKIKNTDIVNELKLPPGEDPLLGAGGGCHQGGAGRLQGEVGQGGSGRGAGGVLRTGEPIEEAHGMAGTDGEGGEAGEGAHGGRRTCRERFLRVGVKGGGCSGLSYSLEFDTEMGPHDKRVRDRGRHGGLRQEELPLSERHDARLRDARG